MINVIIIIATCWELLQFSGETIPLRNYTILPSSKSHSSETERWLRCHSAVCHHHPGPVWLLLQEQESCTLITPQPL